MFTGYPHLLISVFNIFYTQYVKYTAHSKETLSVMNLAFLSLVSASLLQALFAPALAEPADKHIAGPVRAQVEKVVDGDTLAVRALIWLGQEVRVNVRLANIDTPELRGGCALERELAVRARDFIGAVLRAADASAEPGIMLYDIDQDKFGGRVVARVTDRAGADLAQALLRAGLARNYNSGKRGDWCRPGIYPAIGMLEKNSLP